MFAPRSLLTQASGRSGEILPLTGLRIVAALWVVLFHLRGNYFTEFPGVGRLVSPILLHGDLGVDLFFVLSGFVLTLNYVGRMGRGLTRRNVTGFFWARVARVWPAYFVALNIAAAWHGWLAATGGHDPVAPRELSALSYLRQALLVVLWNEPDTDRLTWNGPAWSVSAEALAYVAFPLLVLSLPWLHRALPARWLGVLASAAMLPAIAATVVTGSVYSPYLWLLRLMGAFVSGCLACLAARRIARTARTSRIASRVAGGLVLTVVGTCYVTSLLGASGYAIVVVVLFAPLLIALAVSDRGLSRLLSTRAFVFGGLISYSVYLVHMLLIEPLWWAQLEWPGLLSSSSPLFRMVLLLMPLLACVGGYLLWLLVEEPARRAMRRMYPSSARASTGRDPTPVMAPAPATATATAPATVDAAG